jgi:hypothetical protein
MSAAGPPATLIDVLVLAWQNCECISSKRLKRFLLEAACHSALFRQVRPSEHNRRFLARISTSTSTIDGLLRPFRDAEHPRNRPVTMPDIGPKMFRPVCILLTEMQIGLVR